MPKIISHDYKMLTRIIILNYSSDICNVRPVQVVTNSIPWVNLTPVSGVGGINTLNRLPFSSSSSKGAYNRKQQSLNKHEDDSLCGPSHSEMPRRYIMPEEQRLLIYLLHGYSPAVRPLNNSNEAVQLELGITLAQVLDMDEKNQILVTNVWMDQYWIDEFLVWDPANFSGIKSIRIPSDKIWKPDIVLYNKFSLVHPNYNHPLPRYITSAADFADNKMPALAMVENDGRIFWPVPSKFKSSCKVDVTYFPFDVQTCSLKFGSWTYNGLQVDLELHSKGIELNNYIENGEWKLLSSKAERNVRVYSCCPEPYPDIKFYFILQRRILYYVYHVIYPCILMSTLTLLVFCLPPDSGEKIALGITVYLAFSVLMLSIAEKLPETSESVPIISIYLTVVMSMTSVSVIFTVFVLNLHHPGPKKKEVPAWLRAIVFNQKKLTTANITAEDITLNNLSLKITLENLVHELHKDHAVEGSPVRSRNTSDCLEMPESVLLETGSLSANENQQQNQLGVNLPATQTATRFQRMSHMPPSPVNNNVGLRLGVTAESSQPRTRKVTSAGMQKTNREILRALRKIIEKHEHDDLETHIVDDWRMVAQFVDKILFWVYLCCTLASTIIILIIVPVFRILPSINKKDLSAGNVTMTVETILP